MSPTIGLNAHLLSSQTGYRRAGIHGYIYNLLGALPTAEPAWQYVAFVGEGHPPDHPALHVRRSRINTATPSRRIVWEQLAQPWQLGGLDLVHEMAFVAPVIMPCPFVVTVYDLSFIRYPERLPRMRRLYLRLFTRLSCNRARRVMAISQSTADDLSRLLGIPPTKIDLAIPGIDERFKPLPEDEVEEWRRARGLPERFLLFLGTLEPRKNLPVLLRAYARLPSTERARVHVVLAGGKGWMTDEIDQAIEQGGISATVHRAGFVADEELVWWYNAAEAFVYPSIFEGWGLPVGEAMACGKPVITSNVSSLPEVAGEAGVCLPPNSIEAWTEALARCISDPVWRADRSEAGRRWAKQFTWQQTAEQTIKSYRMALDKNTLGTR
jgi:glycosyltransferase involved in cell wall biosynthesis